MSAVTGVYAISSLIYLLITVLYSGFWCSMDGFTDPCYWMLRGIKKIQKGKKVIFCVFYEIPQLAIFFF